MYNKTLSRMRWSPFGLPTHKNLAPPPIL